MKRVVLYVARFLSIAICVFFGVFLLEVFDPAFGWQSGLAHLIPTVIMVSLAVVAWKKPRIGGWLFLSMALVILLFGIFSRWRESFYLVITAGIIGGLFLFGSTLPQK